MSEYQIVFSQLRVALDGFATGDDVTRQRLADALGRAGEHIRAGMLRTRAEARQSGSLRAGRRYIESADAERVRAAAEILGVPSPLLGNG